MAFSPRSKDKKRQILRLFPKKYAFLRMNMQKRQKYHFWRHKKAPDAVEVSGACGMEYGGRRLLMMREWIGRSAIYII